MKNGTEKDFFMLLGGIYRDINFLEFLMRSLIAKKEGDINKLVQPPYIRGKEYDIYPASYAIKYFGPVAEKFNSLFPEYAIDEEVTKFRNALSHGLVADINNSGTEELIHFGKVDGKLIIKYSVKFSIENMETIRKALHEKTRTLMKLADDNHKLK